MSLTKYIIDNIYLTLPEMLTNTSTNISAVNGNYLKCTFTLFQSYWHTWHTYSPVVPADELWLWPVDLVTMETTGGGVGVKATGFRVVCGVKGGGVGMTGRERWRDEGSVGNSPVVTCGGEGRVCCYKDDTVLNYHQGFTSTLIEMMANIEIQLIYITKVTLLAFSTLTMGWPCLFSHLYFGSNVCGATLRPPPDIWPLLWRSRRALWSTQHGAGRQFSTSLCVGYRVFGEAKWCGFSGAGFSLHQDGRREDGDLKKRHEELVSLSCSINWKVNFLTKLCCLSLISIVVYPVGHELGGLGKVFSDIKWPK